MQLPLVICTLIHPRFDRRRWRRLRNRLRRLRPLLLCASIQAMGRLYAEPSRFYLEEAGIAEERLADVTGDIAFAIAAIIDGSRVMELDGQPLIPVLTFAEDAEGTKLVVRPGGSHLHEYVFGTVDDVFDEDTA